MIHVVESQKAIFIHSISTKPVFSRAIRTIFLTAFLRGSQAESPANGFHRARPSFYGNCFRWEGGYPGYENEGGSLDKKHLKTLRQKLNFSDMAREMQNRDSFVWKIVL